MDNDDVQDVDDSVIDEGLDDEDLDDEDLDDEGYFIDDEGEFVDVATGEIVEASHSVVVSSDEVAVELSFEEARNLTSTIRNAAQMLWVLIKRAHQGRAWHALGYGSWEKYVKAEFDMSRSRAYQILDQAQVITEIEAVVPDGTTVVLSEAAARDLKGMLNEVLPEIQEKTEGLTPDAAEEVLNNILLEQRAALKNIDDDGRAVSGEDGSDDSEVKEKESRKKSGGSDGGGETTGGAGSKHTSTVITDDFGGKNADGDDWVDDWDSDDVEDSNPLDNVDTRVLKETADVAQNLYIAVVALADLPDNLDDAIKIMAPDRAESISEKLSSAQYKLSLFADVWREKTEG